MTAVSGIFSFVLLSALLLGGCASGLNYPSTAGIDKVTRKTLSTSEQKALIDDLQSTGATPARKSVPLLTGSTGTSD